MTPWTIIGWAIITLVALYVMFKGVLPIGAFLFLFFRSLRTKPVEGQQWYRFWDGRIIEVMHVGDQWATVHMYLPGRRNRVYSSSSVSIDGWQRFKRWNLMWLDKSA